MRFRCIRLLTLTAAGVALSFNVAAAQDDTPKMPNPEEMAKMMEMAKKYTAPGEHHKLLDKFVGKWNTETRIVGGQPEKGMIETTWLIDGRWLMSKGQGTMMGRPYEDVTILGYDNFKQSFVFSHVGNMDTAMLTAEGDMTPDGKNIIMYGTLDEYLTGEHDKMVKYVWRMISDDELLFEVHDLPIGETNTKVIEIKYTRAD